MNKDPKMISDTLLEAVIDIWSERQERTFCTISGNCMLPMIKEGDSIVIEQGNKEIKIGDIVTFGMLRNPTIHRIIKIEKRDGTTFYLLKPDRYYNIHPFIPEDQILGKVIEIHGSNGCLHLNSFFWRWINYGLAIRSYMSWKCYSSNSPLWKEINSLVTLRSKIFLRKLSIDIIFWKGIQRISGIWFSLRQWFNRERGGLGND